jgi:hypothetical protein
MKIIEVSEECYQELENALVEAGHCEAFSRQGVIDLAGYCVKIVKPKPLMAVDKLNLKS